MKVIGIDIGTNYTKATDGEKLLIFPSVVAFAEEKEWSLKEETKSVYIGDEALAAMKANETIELWRPIKDGRIVHESFLELAKFAISKIGKPDLIATGLPVKSSKKEREELKTKLETETKAKVLVFPEPVGTLVSMGIETGVCLDIGFGTTDIAVIADMEFLKGDTMLTGVDSLYSALEVTVRSKTGINLSPEEITNLLVNEVSVGRIRSGKKIVVKKEDINKEYETAMKNWVEKIVARVNSTLEGLSTTLLDNFVATGGGILLPGVFEALKGKFAEFDIKKPENPIASNVSGFYKLGVMLSEKKSEEKEKVEEEKVRKRKT
ncbi:MAG: rod shape-determining protein [Archaeoglobaceae archaeon]